MSSAVADVEVRLKFVDKDTSSGISRYLQRLERAARQTESTVNQANNRQRDSHERLSRAREPLAQRAEHAAQHATQQTDSVVNQSNSQQRGSHERLSRARELLAQRAERAVQRAAQQTESAVNQSNSQQRSSYDRLSHAREQLGVRSERAVRREIQQTEAAYRRLESSGTMSQAALAKAAEKTQAKITRLTNEMGKLTDAQKKASQAAEQYEKIQSRINGGVAAGAGLAAAAYTLKSPAEKAIAFDDKMLGMANTAFPERDAVGRVAGSKDLEAVINKSVDLKQGGGGTREQAADALDAMLGKGTLGIQRSKDFLPTVMRTASGSGANPIDIANLSSALVGQGVVKTDSELKTALNMVTASGQAGGFEIKDLAKHLPGQLAIGKSAGMTGLDGLKKILTMNQASVLTSGTTDEAGNNVKNLLAKVSSKDTGKDFEKAGRGDLAEFLVKQRMKGVDAVDAWLNLIDRESEKSPLLKEAMKKLKASKSKPEQTALIESISQLSEGGVIGQYFQDMQARGALFGMRNKDVVDRVGAAVEQNRTEYGANDLNWQTKAQGTSAKLVNAGQTVDKEQKTAMDNLTPAIGRVADAFVDLSQKHPLLSTGVVATLAPLAALSAAAGLSALTLGGGKAGGIAGYAQKAANSQAAKMAGKGGLIGLAALATDNALEKTAGEGSAISRYGSGAINGAALGATVGSIIPGLGTGVGALLGGAGGVAWEGISDLLKKSEQKPVEASANLTVGLAPGLVLQQQTTQSNGLNMQITSGNTGNVWNGAP
ncbi:phage tail tape measure protein [Methylobacter tundripaludum]|uniref:phage tail tape measure protein n=1 Tax=Methylobacter tundripaludum TaxID=173365 RepID=UPI000561A731|nr:phage tail tape measure protein [Methylobacter tundripaludum]